MTNIKFIYDNNLLMGFSMLGHAGFSKGGQPDILCASLSATSQMTVNGVLDWVGLNTADVVLEDDPKVGILVMLLPKGHYEHVVVQQLLKSFELYMIQLEELYPENIKIRREIKNDNSDQ